MGSTDPFYNRKPVPKELIEDVGVISMTPQEEFLNRERKYSVTGTDVRNFSNPGKKGSKDPFYQRKRVPDSMIVEVGQTALNPEEEYKVRERKYSLPDGSDARKFSNTVTPQSDPFYGRRKVSNHEIVGVGETGHVPAQDYAIRDRKQSLFQFSNDPFSELAGIGHRQSISDASMGTAIAATERRRSSAVAPHDYHQHHEHDQHLSKLEPIESRAEEPSSEISELPPVHASTSRGTNGSTSFGPGQAESHHIEEHDPDHVAPDELR